MSLFRVRLRAARERLIVADAIAGLLDYYPQLADKAIAQEITSRIVVPNTGMYGRDYKNVRDRIEDLCLDEDADA